MPYKPYNIILMVPLCTLFLVLYGLANMLQPLSGDLTRLGAYLESDFGWNNFQERFEKNLYRLGTDGVYDRYYDVVVLGDSFSTGGRPYQWQNYLAQATGLDSITFDINDMITPGRGKNFFQSEGYSKFPPKMVVYQTSERGLPLRLAAITGDCIPKPPPEFSPLPMRPQPAAISTYQREVAIHAFGPRMDESVHYLQFLLKRYFKHYLSAGFGKPAKVIRLPLTTGVLFSSKINDEILVYREDLEKHQHSAEKLSAMRCGLVNLQNQAQSNRQTLFVAMVVPDKASAYSEHIDFQEYTHVDLIAYLAQMPGIHLPRLDQAIKVLVRQGVQDIYLPNDTHWGTPGNKIGARTLIRYFLDQGILSQTESNRQGNEPPL